MSAIDEAREALSAWKGTEEPTYPELSRNGWKLYEALRALLDSRPVTENAERITGKWHRSEPGTTLVERGLQPARVQYEPPVRPAASQIEPPSPPRTDS